MSLYSYFVEASKQSDLPNPNGSRSTSVSPIAIKEANEAVKLHVQTVDTSPFQTGLETRLVSLCMQRRG